MSWIFKVSKLIFLYILSPPPSPKILELNRMTIKVGVPRRKINLVRSFFKSHWVFHYFVFRILKALSLHFGKDDDFFAKQHRYFWTEQQVFKFWTGKQVFKVLNRRTGIQGFELENRYSRFWTGVQVFKVLTGEQGWRDWNNWSA